MHVDINTAVLALAILAHAVVARVPPTRTFATLAGVVYAVALALVLWALVRSVW